MEMTRSKESVAVVTGGTSNLLGPAAILFISLRHRSPRLYYETEKYFFLAEGTPSTDIKRVYKDLGIKIIEYDPRMFSEKFDSYYYYTSGISSKFVPFKILSNVRSIIWLDSDQICVKSLDMILDYSDRKGYNALLLDGDLSIGDQLLSNGIEKARELYSTVDYKSRGCCGSIWMITEFPDDIYYNFKEIYNNLFDHLLLPDQAVLDIYFYQAKDTVHISRLVENSALYTSYPSDYPLEKLLEIKDEEMPYLLHSYGAYKFWSGLPHPLWDYYYEEYLDLGGDNFKKKYLIDALQGIMELDSSINKNN